MDPTESIKNLTFSLSVLGAAPVLKADVLAKEKKKRREGGARRTLYIMKFIYNTERILLCNSGWTDSKYSCFFFLFLYKSLECEKEVVALKTEALQCITEILLIW